jgi:hypothetical protein
VSGCTSQRTAVTVTVTPPVAAPSASPVSVCSGNSAMLTATGGSNYQWYSASTGGTLLEEGDDFVTPALTANVTYYVQSSVNGCNSPRTAVTVTVTPPPAAPVINPVSPICYGATAMLTASGSGQIRWYRAVTGGAVLHTGSSFTTPALEENTTYWAETRSGTCVSPRASVTVTVNPLTSNFEYPRGTYCILGANPIPTVSNAGGTFTASPAGIVLNSSTGEIDLATSAVGDYQITYTTTGACPHYLFR